MRATPAVIRFSRSINPICTASLTKPPSELKKIGRKALAAKGPGFPVAVDEEVGKAGAVAGVKEPGGRCDIEEDVRAAHGVRPSSARPMTTESDRDSLTPSDAEAIGRVSGRTARLGC